VIPWRIFGSSGYKKKINGLVLEAFQKRASDDFDDVRHVKTIVRPNTVIDCNAHAFNVKGPTVLPDGSKCFWGHTFGILSEYPKNLGWYVNHYVTKTMEDWEDRLKRGQLGNITRSWDDFNRLDRNEVTEYFSKNRLGKLKKYISEILNVKSKTLQGLKRHPEKDSGYLDKVTLDKSSISLSGWGSISTGNIREKFSVSINQNSIEILTINYHRRPDVEIKLHKKNVLCGFEIICSRKNFPYYDLSKLQNISITINSENAIEFLRLNVPALHGPFNLSFPEKLSKFYRNLVLGANQVLEYGSGSSTLFCAMNSIELVSVESDAEFLKNLEININSFCRNTNHLKLIFVDIGPTKELGYPINQNFLRQFPSYPLAPWIRNDQKNYSPDVILIYGRFRVACMLVVMAYISKHTKVLFDDYIDRTYKNVIEALVKPTEIIDRAAYFEINPGIISPQNLLNSFGEFFNPN
jgi:hypothetical protein